MKRVRLERCSTSRRDQPVTTLIKSYLREKKTASAEPDQASRPRQAPPLPTIRPYGQWAVTLADLM